MFNIHCTSQSNFMGTRILAFGKWADISSRQKIINDKSIELNDLH